MDNQEFKTLYAEAQRLLKVRDYSMALVILERLGNAKPNLPDLVYVRAACLGKVGRTYEASQLCNRLKHQFRDPRGLALKAQLAEARKAGTKVSDVAWQLPLELPSEIPAETSMESAAEVTLTLAPEIAAELTPELPRETTPNIASVSTPKPAKPPVNHSEPTAGLRWRKNPWFLAGITAGTLAATIALVSVYVGAHIGASAPQRETASAEGEVRNDISAPKTAAAPTPTTKAPPVSASVTTPSSTTGRPISRDEVNRLFANLDQWRENADKARNISAIVRLAEQADEQGVKYIVDTARAVILNPQARINQRWMSCYVLSDIAGEQAVPLLTTILLNEPNSMIRGVAACALGRSTSPETKRVLERVAQSETNPHVLTEIQKSLERMGGANGVGRSQPVNS